MGCDLCGYNGELNSALVEKSLMNICSKCLRFGKKVERNKNFDVNDIIKRKPVIENLNLLKEDYAHLIKESREKLKLTPDDLAKKLNEKASLIHKVENKEIIPNDVLIKKLESFFKIKLQETYSPEEIKTSFKNTGITIGDLIKIKKK